MSIESYKEMFDIKEYSYTVFWSEENKGFIGKCDKFPSLSHVDNTPQKALEGIIEVTKHASDIIDYSDIPEFDAEFFNKETVEIPQLKKK